MYRAVTKLVAGLERGRLIGGRLRGHNGGGERRTFCVRREARRCEVAEEFEDRGNKGSRSGGEQRYADPYGLYRRWFEAWEGERETDDSLGIDEIEEMWRRWFRGAARGSQRGSPFGTGPQETLGPLWDRMARSIREEIMLGGGLPEDPVEFFLRWYEATSEQWAKSADELLGKSEFLESNARLRQEAARSYRELKKASEEGLKKLQMPSRSDLAGVAKLVVGVEDKLDRIEEAFGEFVYGGSEPATAESVRGLEERMERLEEKMDRVLEALEKREA